MSSCLGTNLQTVKDTATIIWTVNGFANQVGKDRSPTFATQNDKISFVLRLNSNNKLFGSFCENFVFIYLWTSKANEHLPVRYRIALLDSDGKKHFVKEYKFTFDYENTRNVTNYIHRDKCKPFLVNDTLKIACELEVLEQSPATVSPVQLQLDTSFAETSKDYETFLENGKLTDFTVVVGGKKFLVHKSILAARSPVFGAMFEHGETKEVLEGQLVIDESDLTEEVFQLLIRYIYCGKIESLDEYATELFVAADMYQLDHLKSLCEKSLAASLEIDSVCGVLMLADMHNSGELKAKCIQFAIGNCERVMLTDGWKQLMAANRIDLLADLFKVSATLSPVQS